MKVVDELTYLGSLMTSNGKFTQDIERRRAGATRELRMLRSRFWGRREKSFEVKMKVFNAVGLPVLLYDPVAWALTKSEERSLDEFEMGMLRSIAGVRWNDFVRNGEIRERLCQLPVSLKFRSARMKWFGMLRGREMRKK